MKSFPLLLLAAVALVSCSTHTVQQGPLKVIIETDMGNDIDDVLALDLALQAANDGKMEILAVGTHKLSPAAPAFTHLLCSWFGHPEIPVVQASNPVFQGDYTDYTPVVVGSGKYEIEDQIYPEAVSEYRKILAAAQDHSVSFISLGFCTTLARLIESPADSITPLSGVELVAKKVNCLSIMAGSFGQYKRPEFNVRNDIKACQTVFEKWPTVVYLNPYEIGVMIKYPSSAISEKLSWAENHPVRDAYEAYRQMPYDRPVWDMFSVAYLLEPGKFTEALRGDIVVRDDAYMDFTENPDGKFVILDINQTQAFNLLNYLVEYTTRNNNQSTLYDRP